MRALKVVLLTPGQPSTNPRLLKEAVALSKAGLEVTVVYNFFVGWADDTDKAIFSQYPSISWILTGGHPRIRKLRFLYTRLRQKVYKSLARLFPGTVFFQERAAARCHGELTAAAAAIKADLYIAHNLGALSPAEKAARKNKARYAFDAEDFHRGQTAKGAPVDRTVEVLENRYMPGVSYCTAASPLIGKAYRQLFPALDPVTINNVFPLENLQQAPAPLQKDEALRLFWFSQTVGPQRGLEVVLTAVGLLKECVITVTLLGDCSPEYQQTLRGLVADGHTLEFIGPVPSDEIFRIAARSHVGIASEMPYSENRDICLTNKLFTYLLSGNAILASNTSAHRLFFQDYPGPGLLFRSDDPAGLAKSIHQLYTDRELLHRCRTTGWDLARTTLNWENESVNFVELVKSVLN